jgi:hypothetical protein
MLPDYNQGGNLPEGSHRATAAEVLDRFGTASARRLWLAERLRDLLEVAKFTGKLERVFLWGSFVTSKPSPNDLNVLLVVASDFDLDASPEECKVLFDHPRGRIRFNADVFWTKASIGQETLNFWLDTYQTGKDFKRNRIVAIAMR